MRSIYKKINKKYDNYYHNFENISYYKNYKIKKNYIKNKLNINSSLTIRNFNINSHKKKINSSSVNLILKEKKKKIKFLPKDIWSKNSNLKPKLINENKSNYHIYSEAVNYGLYKIKNKDYKPKYLSSKFFKNKKKLKLSKINTKNDRIIDPKFIITNRKDFKFN